MFTLSSLLKKKECCNTATCNPATRAGRGDAQPGRRGGARGGPGARVARLQSRSHVEGIAELNGEGPGARARPGCS